MNLYDLGGETHLKGCSNSDLRRTEVVVLHRCSPLRIRKPGPARLAAHAVRALPRLTRRTSVHRRAPPACGHDLPDAKLPPNPLRTIPWISP